MSYLPNIPQASDNPSVSQGDLLGNFQSLNTAFNLNHVSLGSGGSAGKHNFAELVNQASVPTFMSSEGGLYTKAVEGVSQLFYSPDATANEYQLSRVISASFPLFGLNTNNYNSVGTKFTGGWTFLPGGMLLQYGTFDNGSLSIPTSGTVIFPVSFTATPYTIFLTLLGNNSTHTDSIEVQKTGVGNTSFLWTYSGGSNFTGFYWEAKGV